MTKRLGKLHKAFGRNARYFGDAPAGSRYGIRVGSRMLFAADTKELFDKYVAATKGSK